MKNPISSLLTLAGLFVFGLSSTHAQNAAYDRGSKIVAGSFAYSNVGGDLFLAEADEDGRITTIQFNPSLSSFVMPGLAVGGKFLFQRSSQDNDSATQFGIGPQFLYFIGSESAPNSVKGKTFPYVGATAIALLNTVRTRFSGEKKTFNSTGISAAFGVGMTHMLTNNAALFVEGAYELDHLSGEGDSASGNKFNIVAGLAVFLY